MGLLISQLGICTNIQASEQQSEAAQARQSETVQTLQEQIQQLKRNYVQEIRRLRALEAKLLVLKAMEQQKQVNKQEQKQTQTQAIKDNSDDRTVLNTHDQTKQKPSPDSIQDSNSPSVSIIELLTSLPDFGRKLTLEAGVAYSHYDRKRLSLNGFLALDAIFLGNISVNRVVGDKLTYTLGARYGFAPRWQAGVRVPFVQRRVVYQKGGAGGSASSVGEAQQDSTPELGDIGLSLSYQLLAEAPDHPELVVMGSVTVPTGRSPYGIKWRTRTVSVPGSNDTVDIVVPDRLATGNGLWSYGVTLSTLKTLDPAIVFAHAGYSAYQAEHFNDLSTDPNTQVPGKVRLGQTWQLGLGMAFALNNRTSFSLSFNDQIRTAAEIRYDGQSSWTKLVGSDANAATLNASLTHALSAKQTLLSTLSIGITPDAPDFTLEFKMPLTI
jgi:hypothetical protein